MLPPRVTLTLFAAGAVLCSACAAPPVPESADRDSASAPVTVAVTVAPQAWLVESIGGERVKVEVAVSPGESPESFQPTHAEASRLLASNLYFSIGVPAENGPWFEAVGRRMPVVDLVAETATLALPPAAAETLDDPGDVTAGPGHGHGHTGGGGGSVEPGPKRPDGAGSELSGHGGSDPHSALAHHHDARPHSHIHIHDGAHGHAGGQAGHGHVDDGRAHTHTHTHAQAHNHDPHPWLNPAELALFADRMAAALTEVDPEHADVYARGLEATKAQLRTLDAELQATLDPHRGRAFLIYHPAWGHFAEEYGLIQLAVEVDGQSPSDSELTDIRRMAVERRCAALFVQPQISDRLALRLGQSLGVPVKVLDPLERDLPTALRTAAERLAASFEVDEAS
ncbi:MAG: zinc ABC transporter substrate-binding protein [Acidobacteriota bacterium]